VSESIHIRPFASSAGEYEAIAQIAAQVPADMLGDYEYARSAELQALDALLARGAHFCQRYVADAGGMLVGCAQLFHIPWLREPGYYWAAIRVHPAHQRHGIGGRLAAYLLDELRRVCAAAVWVEVHESMPALAARAEELGFREAYRSWPFVLEVRDFDHARFAQVGERIAQRGIAITTLDQERARGAGWLSRLYDLHVTLTREIPLPWPPDPDPGVAWFERYAIHLPTSMPEAFFIAKDGERYVGESFLHRVEQAPGDLSQRATGIRGAYRGSGLAVALKLATIAYARQHGFERIWTGVESHNPGMLAINAKLGFAQQPGLIVFEKQLQ